MGQDLVGGKILAIVPGVYPTTPDERYRINNRACASLLEVDIPSSRYWC